jgi:uncharacterized protein (DUF2461 family)
LAFGVWRLAFGVRRSAFVLVLVLDNCAMTNPRLENELIDYITSAVFQKSWVGSFEDDDEYE